MRSDPRADIGAVRRLPAHWRRSVVVRGRACDFHTNRDFDSDASADSHIHSHSYCDGNAYIHADSYTHAYCIAGWLRKGSVGRALQLNGRSELEK